MIPVYVSNGAFITRHNGRDYRLIAQYPPMLDCDGVEFLMYFVWQDEVRELRRFLKNTHLRFPVTHMDKQIGEALSNFALEGREEALRHFRRDLDPACELESQKLVLHLWNGPGSDDHFADSLKVLPEMLDLAQKRGLELTVENVTCINNICLNHLNDMLCACPGIRFTYDTKMAQLHGENELLAAKEYMPLLTSGAITHLHLNDTRPTPGMDRLPIMHIGDGEVRFAPFFKLLKQTAFNGTATVESTSVNPDGTVDVKKLNESLNKVRRALNGDQQPQP